MNEQTMPQGQRSGKQGGNFIPALCNILGTLILIVVILSCIPVTIPRMMGYEMYNIVSGSMEPEIPVGSIIYVKYTEPSQIEEGDVIAFVSSGSVVSHRVVANYNLESKFSTKGDANEEEDFEEIPYAAVLGRVEKHYPYVGALLQIYSTQIGKIYALIFAACGAMLNILAGQLRNRSRRELTRKLKEEIERH